MKNGQAAESEGRALQETATGGVTTPDSNGVAPDSILLQAGPNKGKSRSYTPEFIQHVVGYMDGAFAHVDHPTKSGARDLPERSISSVAAIIKNPHWDAAQEAAVGDLHFTGASAGQEMAALFAMPEMRERAGLSIYWPSGFKSDRVKLGESWIQVPTELTGEGPFSVDFVTRPNAGGRVSPIAEGEEDQDMNWETMTAAEILENRPDLAAELATPADAPEEVEEEVSPEAAAESARITVLEGRLRRADGRSVLEGILRESKLPARAASLVADRFADAECDAALPAETKALSESVKAYVVTLTEALSESGGRTVVGAISEAGDAESKPKSAADLLRESHAPDEDKDKNTGTE